MPELTFNVSIDPNFDNIKTLRDALAKAVTPNGGYRAMTTDDSIEAGGIGEQMVGAEWWIPEAGCDSLEQTLDSIKGKIDVALHAWCADNMRTASLSSQDNNFTPRSENV